MTIGQLADRVRALDARQAPGSETALLAEFIDRMGQLGAHRLTIQGCQESRLAVSPDEVWWWTGAYAAQAADDTGKALDAYRRTH